MGSGNIMDIEGKRLQEPMDQEDCSKLLFSVHKIYIAPINSQQLQLSIQDLHKIIPVNVPAQKDSSAGKIYTTKLLKEEYIAKALCRDKTENWLSNQFYHHMLKRPG